MTQAAGLRSEQEHHRSAFELYQSLGAKRSYRQVAGQLGVSMSAVKLWAKSFDWRGRLQEREADTVRQIAERALQTSVGEGVRQRKIVQMALIRLAKAIADGKVKMQMGDLDRLIRLQSFIDDTQPKDPGHYSAEEICDIVQAADRETKEELLRVLRARLGLPPPGGTEKLSQTVPKTVL